MDLEKVKDTINKLLNLAENDAAAKGEVENAMRFAARLMEQHQLTEEDVRLNRVDEKILDLENQTFAELSGYMGGNKFCHWESDAASFACAFVGGVKWYYVEGVPYRINGILQYHTGKWAGQSQTRTRVTFYGIQEDVEMAFEVYNQLIMVIASMAKLKWGGVYRGPGRNYCEGFVKGIWSKWYSDQDSQKKLAKASTSTALVVIDSRQLVVKRKEELATQWLEKSNKKLKSATKNRAGSFNAEAQLDGRNDGHSYNATKPVAKKRIGSAK